LVRKRKCVEFYECRGHQFIKCTLNEGDFVRASTYNYLVGEKNKGQSSINESSG
jgi:hypothetical protein